VGSDSGVGCDDEIEFSILRHGNSPGSDISEAPPFRVTSPKTIAGTMLRISPFDSRFWGVHPEVHRGTNSHPIHPAIPAAACMLRTMNSSR
jgi:hypothetical protein